MNEENIDLENVSEEQTEELDFNEETPEEVEEVVEEVVEEEKPINPDDFNIELRGGDEQPVDYGEDIDPDDVKTIGTVVEKQTAAMKRALQDAQDRIEVDNYLKDYPELSKYRPVVEKYMKNDVYSKIPVKNLFPMVASNELMSIGAKREREAQIKADSTKTAGTEVRKPQAGATDWKAVSKDDFEQHKRRVLGQR